MPSDEARMVMTKTPGVDMPTRAPGFEEEAVPTNPTTHEYINHVSISPPPITLNMFR